MQKIIYNLEDNFINPNHLLTLTCNLKHWGVIPHKLLEKFSWKTEGTCNYKGLNNENKRPCY